MSPRSTPTNATQEVDIFLSTITYISCVVSIIFLLLTIMTYLSSRYVTYISYSCVCEKISNDKKLGTPHRKLRQSEHGQLLLNLCFGLLGLYLLFIVAIHSTAVTALCMLVSALLQYFFLVSFMAMAVEAIHLYMKLVLVLGSVIPHYPLKATITCWGI